MPTTIKFYDRNYNGGDLKMAILAGYTFSASHKNWSDVSSYDIGATGDYPSGGVSVVSSYDDHKLTITDLSLCLVTAQNVSHLVLYVPATGKLVLAVEFDSSQTFQNTYLMLDWPPYINLYHDYSLIRFYTEWAIGLNLKMVILSEYTFNPSHQDLADISSYEINSTGNYQSGGVPININYVDSSISIENFYLYFVNASNISHLVIINSETDKLFFAVEFSEPKTWSNSIVLFDWTTPIEISQQDIVLQPLFGNGGGNVLDLSKLVDVLTSAISFCYANTVGPNLFIDSESGNITPPFSIVSGNTFIGNINIYLNLTPEQIEVEGKTLSRNIKVKIPSKKYPIKRIKLYKEIEF